MARRRSGGFGGILALLAGAWLISLLVRGPDQPPRVETTPQATSTRSQNTSADVELASRSETDTAARTTPDPAVEKEATPRWIRGSKVAFRAGPATAYGVLDRFNSGRKVTLLFNAGDWSKVSDDLTAREGWIASRFLEEREPPARKPKIERPEPAQEQAVVPKVEISDAEIVDRIIASSIAGYSGNCPCPFNVDRAGRRCGRRSAYSRPGGASPICFVGDVTPAMIAAFKRRP